MSDETERKYFDGEGRECSLDTLCRREPGWAANRLRALQTRVKELEKERDEIELFTQVLSLKGELDISRERIEELEEENLLLQRVALEGPQ